MVGDNSRYTRNTIGIVPNRDGTGMVSAILPRRPRAQQVTFAYYQWTGADRVDHLARAYYGDDSLWWIIAEANPEVLVWDEVAPGAVIRIPDVNG